MMRETVDRLRVSQEENEMLTRRRDELEARVAALEAEYEELLGLLLFRGTWGFD
jgi:kinesin family member 5